MKRSQRGDSGQTESHHLMILITASVFDVHRTSATWLYFVRSSLQYEFNFLPATLPWWSSPRLRVER